jgi:hypothetical protein
VWVEGALAPRRARLALTRGPFFSEDEPMQLIDLLPEETLALVALTRAVARADGAISPLEGRAIALIAAELGEGTYRKLFAKAAESFPDQASLQGFLARIERPEARALIYETILALAGADSISAEEEPLIVWLHEAWQIQ